MSLVPVPTADLSDAEVANVLRRAVGVINPLIDLLWQTDPIGLKQRSGRPSANSPIGRTLDAAAWVLDEADVPGTPAWQKMDVDDRVTWWVHRVGALNSVVVAVPGVLGAVADRLPVQDLLGFASQAIVLCAVANELGMTARQEHVRLLGAILCDRDLGPDVATSTEAPKSEDVEATGAVKALWHLVGIFRAIGDELVKRPRPRRIFRYLGMVPALGVVADYFGEYGALKRAAKRGRVWIAQHRSGV